MLKLIVILFISLNTYAKDLIKVAVLDTGYDFESTWPDAEKQGIVKPKLCETGHKDFTNTGLTDTNGHGTHVAGIIGTYAKNANYCLVILKTFDSKSKNNTNENAVYKAMAYARSIGVDVINYSGGGRRFILEEYLQVKKNLDNGILIVAAAGNDASESNYQVHNVKIIFNKSNSKSIKYGYKVSYINKKTLTLTNLEPESTYYPATYDSRIISVMSYSKKGRHNFSNYGAAYSHKEDGNSVLSLLPNNKYGKLSGTSMSTPKQTGRIIRNWDVD